MHSNLSHVRLLDRTLCSLYFFVFEVENDFEGSCYSKSVNKYPVIGPYRVKIKMGGRKNGQT